MEQDTLDFAFTRDLKDLQDESNLAELFKKENIKTDIQDSYFERYEAREPISEGTTLLTVTTEVIFFARSLHVI